MDEVVCAVKIGTKTDHSKVHWCRSLFQLSAADTKQASTRTKLMSQSCNHLQMHSRLWHKACPLLSNGG